MGLQAMEQCKAFAAAVRGTGEKAFMWSKNVTSHEPNMSIAISFLNILYKVGKGQSNELEQGLQAPVESSAGAPGTLGHPL